MDDNITVLVDAKMEYTKQLTNILVPYIFEGIKSIYETSKSVCRLNNDRNVLMRFQEQLSQIPKWNQEIIDEEYSRIVENSGCDWLDELVTAVFLSHTKILTSIKSNKKQNKINLKIPKIDHFVHKCYIESAREIWKNPYLFSDSINQCDYQRNVRDCNNIISESIEETIRKLLPVKSILKEYLGDNTEDDNFIPAQYRDNLRKLVKKELELVNNTNENLDLKNVSEIIKEDIETELKNQDLKTVGAEETKPVEAEETKPVEAEETKPVEAEETKPVEAEETKPVEAEETPAVETKPAEETKPVEAEETKPVEVETKPVAEETNSVEAAETNSVVSEETKPVEVVETNSVEETNLNIIELAPEKNNNDIKVVELTPEQREEEGKVEEILETENKVLDLSSNIEELTLDNDRNLTEIKPDTVNEINLDNVEEENNITCEISEKKNGEEIKEVNLINNIINTDLYEKDLNESKTEEDIGEINLEDMNFKKMDIGDMKIETLDTIDDIFGDNSVENELESKTDPEPVKDDNIKRIVIEDDKNNLKKYTKDKNNSFRFFD